MPIASNARHRVSSPKVARKEWSGLVIIDMGYAVNQTEDLRVAAAGLGLANGFFHTPPMPENWPAISEALASMDFSCSQLT